MEQDLTLEPQTRSPEGICPSEIEVETENDSPEPGTGGRRGSATRRADPRLHSVTVVSHFSDLFCFIGAAATTHEHARLRLRFISNMHKHAAAGSTRRSK